LISPQDIRVCLSVDQEGEVKRISLLFILALSAVTVLHAEGWSFFRGTVTEMRTVDCPMPHGIVTAMAGAPSLPAYTCPEYTVVGDRVVYVVVARRSDQFIPLAENMNFQIRKNELVTFSDNERKSRFVIQRMTLRTEWDRNKARKDLALKVLAEHGLADDPHDPPESAPPHNQPEPPLSMSTNAR
jgi:hypothetical protein